MATKKPVSTISYNTEKFLKEKLDSWIEAHLIQSYMYICHKGEEGDKDHIHLRIEPNKSLDVMDLSDALQEWRIGDTKPLGVRPFRPSKEEDWLLYAVHDADYLRVKYQGGESREKLPYTWQDIKANENFDVEVAYIRARASLRHTAASIIARLHNGESAVRLIEEGINVYTINGITNAMRPSEVRRLTDEKNEIFAKYTDILRKYEVLRSCLFELGFVLTSDSQGNLILDDEQPLWLKKNDDFIEKKC